MNPLVHSARHGRQARLRLASWILLASIVLASASPALAQDTFNPEFSSREANAQRLASVEADLRDRAATSDPAARDLLLQLEAALYQHREALDYLANMNREVASAREALSGWYYSADQETKSLRVAAFACGTCIRQARNAPWGVYLSVPLRSRAEASNPF